MQRHMQRFAQADWPRFELGQTYLDSARGSSAQANPPTATLSNFDEAEPGTESLAAQSLPKTPTKDGITVLVAEASSAQFSHTASVAAKRSVGKQQAMKANGSIKGKRSPSNRRDPVPMIVKVATGVTSRIVEPSIFTEAEMDQIMNVPSYIYFEEHHALESYDFDRQKTV